MGGYIFRKGCIVTMGPGRQIFPEGTVVVLDGKIIWAGEGEWDEKLSPVPGIQYKEIDCQEKCVLPGLIDCGGYAGFGYMHHLNVEKKGRQAEALLRELPPEFFEVEGECVARQRVGLGYTTGVVNYPWMGDESREHHLDKIRGSLKGQRKQKIRMVTGVGIPAKEMGEDDRESIFSLIEEERQKREQSGWRLYLGNLVGEQGRHVGINRKVEREERDRALGRVKAAKQMGIPLTVNVFKNDAAAMENEAEDIWEGSKWLFQYGIDLTYQEIMEIQKHDIAVAHVVEETIRYCPFAEMLERGIPCALMNENGFRGGSLDPFQTARRAQMIEQLRFDDLFYLPVGKQLELMTIDAARVLGMDKEIGSLEVGKRADIITVDLQRPRTTPFYDMPIHRMMMDGNSSQIAEVMIDGELLVEKGELLRKRTASEEEQENLWLQKLESFLQTEERGQHNTAGKAYAGW